MQEENQNDIQEEIVFPEDDFASAQTTPETEKPAPETAEQPEAETAETAEQPAAEDTEAAEQPAAEAEEAKEEESDKSDGGASRTFADFGFSAELMQGISEAGFIEPTPIQAKAMPLVMKGVDLIGQALTGSGKTAAFGLPIIDKIAHQEGLNFLVLVPTRELATQVSGELFRLGRYTGLRTAAFTGGQSYSRQEQLLRQGINALVATPGRLIDLIESGHFEDINPAHIVVDEADEMLDMGFIEDVRRIFQTFPGPRQTLLFSATMPRPVVQLAEEILNDPVNITTSTNEIANNECVSQLFFVIEEPERANAVIRLIDAEDVQKAIIFCRTKEETDSLNILLSGRGYNVNCLHGDMEQAARSRVMNAFRRGEIDILVATDVAARGLDVDDITHVFNYHLPFDSRGYVHRIGRTGRAGKTGTAITLVTPRELRALDMIRKNVGAQIENRLVPTRTEVTEMRLKKIFRELNEVELDVDMLNQVQTLIVNHDLPVLIAKLVAHQLASGGDTGPEHIGIAGQRLERLLSPKPRERGNRKGDKFGRRADRFGRDDRDGDRPFRKRFDRDDRRRRDDFDERPPYEENAPTWKHYDDEEPATSRHSDEEQVHDFRRDDREGGERPFKKHFDRDGERPFKKHFDRDGEDRPFKKHFDRDGEDRPFRKSFDRDGDRPFRKSFDREDRPAFDRDGDRPFRKSFDRDGDRPYKKRFDRDGGDRPAFDRDGDRPYKKRFDRDGGDRPAFDRGGDKPFAKKKPLDGDRKPFDKKAGKKRHDDAPTNWYFN